MGLGAHVWSALNRFTILFWSYVKKKKVSVIKRPKNRTSQNAGSKIRANYALVASIKKIDLRVFC